ncbi:MAG: prolyl oligopeptidase family serine peptidase [Planctomycetota bacterium]
MSERTPTPCGAWPSPLTAERIVRGTIGLSSVRLRGDEVLWLERRPSEGGRSVLVSRGPDGATRELTPTGMNTRTRVHEYGGGDYALLPDGVAMADFADQRWYRVGEDGTTAPISDLGYRLADAEYDRVRGRLVCVQEDHSDDFEPKSRLISLDLEGGDAPVVIAEGNDFYAAPRLSPDGSRLAYLAWNHPDMPWDQCELWVVHFEAFGQPGIRERVAGGEGVSASLPRWSPRGALCFVDDSSGYWNLYRHDQGRTEALCPREADFAPPAWTFGQSHYAFLDEDRLAVSWLEEGRWRLGLLEQGALRPLDLPWTEVRDLEATPTHVVCVAASPTALDAVVRLEVASGEVEVLRSSGELDLDPALFSPAEPLRFPTTLDGQPAEAHALYYAPRNPACEPLPGERPPLLVLSHGGPTSMARAGLSLGVQYWTSRGFAVVDVNYGGSSGYGRAYRERLNGRWGLVDVEDCVRAAEHLVERGLADPARLAIRGGSAGGYTTLCALTFRDTFRAGASHFGVSDLEALARDTHKFESRYLERLVGPFPARSDLYRERSPIHHTDGLSCPVILFQGLEDRVVPPNQAERMVEALRAKGIPVAYVAFEGEQHGFRKAENIKAALEGELYFYGRVFGFQPAGELEAVLIENLDE